jgi:ribosomal protein S20
LQNISEKFMPIIKSAIKRMRQTIKRRAQNVTTKRGLKTAVKAFVGDKSKENLSAAQSKLDIAVKKNLLSKNTAARKKAQLARQAKEAAKPSAKPADKKPATVKKTAAVKKAVTKKPTAKAATKKAVKKTTKTTK